ncbi:hypothetical protein J25TS5_28130 [Paenibacillus faecis]|uniref:hypothetical protein n=1 Tax=Paenibacillus faecis TaxID=862114 RepID=UPI001B261155|nr:hypothetical protein [Paenibacillus faecis]GIO85881.1 hypothetical protein J25TS5_28130 [Paenibacillus faecis]
MRAFAKSILISILVTVAIIVFTNFIYFFPWYTTLIVETFHVSQKVASDNYLKKDYRDEVLEELQKRPIFNQRPDDIQISVRKVKDDDDEHSAEGDTDAKVYENLDDDSKPYRQRGKPVTITLSAVYPFKMKLWGREIEQEFPVSFTMKTIGLKHYKDLPYDEYQREYTTGDE